MASNVKITFEFDGKKYVLPVLPPSIQITSPSGNESAEVIKLGEITIMKTRKLRTMTIESFFPVSAQAFPFCSTKEDFKRPAEYLKAFTNAQENKIPARFTVEGVGLNAFWVTVEEFSYTFGRDENVEYSLSLKEYKPYGQTSKTMEQYNDIFDDSTEQVSSDSDGEKREPEDYAIGDHVFVSGAYFKTPTGMYPPSTGLANFATEPLTSALYEFWHNRKNIPTESLHGQRCIIIDRETSKTNHYDIPIAGEIDIPKPTPFPYHVADLDSRESYGWVAEYQMKRIPQ